MKGIDIDLSKIKSEETTKKDGAVELEVNQYTCILALGYDGTLRITELFPDDFIKSHGHKARVKVMLNGANYIAKKIKNKDQEI